MRILKSGSVKFIVVPHLLAAMAVGPVWATDYDEGSAAIVRSDKGTDNAEDGIIITGNRTVVGSNAVTIEGTAGADGAGSATGINVSNNVQVTSSNGRSIQINDGATFDGPIFNNGHINNGITLSGDVNKNGVFVTNTNEAGKASIFGGLVINNNALFNSSVSETVLIDQHGYIDYIKVESGSSLTNTVNNPAIRVASEGQLGGSFTYNDSYQTAGTGTAFINEGSVIGNLSVSSGGNVNGNIQNDGVWTGDIIVNDGGAIKGTINNTGTFTGDILINGSHTAETDKSVYYSKGESNQQATMTGGYKVGNNQTVESTVDTIHVGEYSSLSNISVAAGSTLKSSGANKNAVLIDQNASMAGISESDGIILIDGTLLSDEGSALSVKGDIAGTIQVGSAGLIVGKGGTNDAAILLDSSNGSPDHKASIDNSGVIKGRIDIGTDQTLDAKSAYTSSGASNNRAVLTGVNNSGGGYTINSGATVTSKARTINVGEYAYVDSIIVNGKLTSTGSSAIYVDGNGQLGGNLSAASVSGGRIGSDIEREESDTVIDIEGEVSSTTDYAIKLDANALTVGVIALKKGATLSGSTTAHGSILIEGDYQGKIQNEGVINGNIVVAGKHRVSSGSLLHTLGDSSSDFNQKYIVKSGGQALSLSGTEIVAESESMITGIEVEAGGVLGSDASETIRVASGATVTSVTNSGTLAGSVMVTGTGSRIGTVTVNAGGKNEGTADHTIELQSGGAVDQIVVNGTSNTNMSQYGALSATAENKSAIHIANGATLGTTEAAKVLDVNGKLFAMKGNAVEIGGSSQGEISIGQYGSIYAGEADDSAIHISGTHTGKLANAGEIGSSITVTGTHNSTTKAYEAMGTSATAWSRLIGGYKVSDGGSVSSGSDTVHMKSYSMIDGITVTGSNSKIETTGANNSGIFVDTNSELGVLETENAITISDGGLVTGSNNSGSTAIKVTGVVNGKIAVSNGGLLGSHTAANAIDFTGAKTALNFVQTGDTSVAALNSMTKGQIIGSSFGTDTVSIKGGSFEGNLSSIEHLIISNDSYIKMTGGFTLPEKTTVYLNGKLTSDKALIESDGVVTTAVSGSSIAFMPDNDAYRNLYTNGSVITVVDADSVADGALERLTVESGSALLQTKSYVDGGDIKVHVQASKASDLKGVLGNALISAVDALSVNEGNPDANQILNSLNQPKEKVEQLEKEVRPDTSGHTHKASRQMTLTTQGIIHDRISSTRSSGMNFGDDGFGFGLYGNSYDDNSSSQESDGQSQEDDKGQNRDRPIRKMDYTLLNGGTFWGQMMYMEGTQDKNVSKEVDGYSNRAGGIVIGIDTILLDSFRLGVAATYGFGVVNTETGRTTESHNFLGTVYGSWEDGGYFVDTMFTLGSADNETERRVSGNKVSGSYGSSQWSLRTLAGYRFTVGENWEFTPIAEMNYGKVSFDSYTPKGNGVLAEKIDIQDYSTLELGLGFRVRGVLHNGTSYVEPDFTLMSYRDIETRGSQVNYTFLAGGPVYLIEGPKRDSQRHHASLGMYFDLGRNWFIRTAYDYHWSSTYRSHGLNAKFRYHY